MRIITLFILSCLLLTQCENIGEIIIPQPGAQRPGNPTPNKTEKPKDLNEIVVKEEQQQKNELFTNSRYPNFQIGSAISDDYTNFFAQLSPSDRVTPPDQEDIHANTAISTFRALSFQHSNAIMSPFLFTSDNHGQTTLSNVMQLTGNKLNITYTNNLNLEVDKAVYFSGNWEQAGTPQATNVNFMNSPVPGVNISGKCYYYKNESMHLVYLPIRGQDFSAYIFIPTKANDLSQLLANMQFPQMNEAVQKLKKRDCQIKIPTFRIYANFAPSESARAISFLQLDQYGCEFTSVHTLLRGNNMMGATAMGTYQENEEEELDLAKIKSPYLKNSSQESIQLEVNRPFFFVLRHLKTGEFLATAAVNNLKQTSGWHSVVQQLSSQEMAPKQPTLERFGWGYKVPKSKRLDQVFPTDEHETVGDQ